MRYHVIGNEKQVRALGLAGVQGSAVTSAQEACDVLEGILKDKSVGTVLVSSPYYEDPSVAAVITRHEQRGVLPVIMRLSE